MADKTKCWDYEEGKLTFDVNCDIWLFTSASGSRKFTIIPWARTKKGPLTEVVLYEGEKYIIIEILERIPNEKLFSHDPSDETAKKVLEMCRTLSNVDMSTGEYYMFSSLHRCVERLIERLYDEIKSIHVYYGNGLFFGMKKSFGAIRVIESIPKRCLEFPGTRLDSMAD